MTVEVRLRPEAEQDLADAAAWYEEQRPCLGRQFLDEAQVLLAADDDTGQFTRPEQLVDRIS